MGKHISIPLPGVEVLNLQQSEISPLISKCQIKVCYVSDEPNRNGSVITKEVATKMAPSLRGAAIVGRFLDSKQDFNGHDMDAEITDDGMLVIKDATKPYGFVDLNAKVWFQKFLDDGDTEHEYLMTEGYLWTGQYPEAQRVIDMGNNQSMELDENSVDGSWAEDENGWPEFFIINEAVISKLCILGEDVEPCFEGSQITKVKFSFDEDFKNTVFSMLEQIKNKQENGGKEPMYVPSDIKIGDSLWESVYSYLKDKYSAEDADMRIYGIYENDENTKFAIVKDRKNDKFRKITFSFDPTFEVGDAEDANVEIEFDEPAQYSDEEYDAYIEAQKVEPALDEPVQYSLDKIPEYIELNNQYSALNDQYSELKKSYEAAQTELESLRTFRNQVERKQKEEMIDSFYMLSDEDKKDVIDNIDKYSVDDIEAKLSVICFRQKVSFKSPEDEVESKEDPTTYNLDGNFDSAPQWVKAVRETAKNMKD